MDSGLSEGGRSVYKLHGKNLSNVFVFSRQLWGFREIWTTCTMLRRENTSCKLSDTAVAYFRMTLTAFPTSQFGTNSSYGADYMNPGQPALQRSRYVCLNTSKINFAMSMITGPARLTGIPANRAEVFPCNCVHRAILANRANKRAAPKQARAFRGWLAPCQPRLESHPGKPGQPGQLV